MPVLNICVHTGEHPAAAVLAVALNRSRLSDNAACRMAVAVTCCLDRRRRVTVGGGVSDTESSSRRKTGCVATGPVTETQFYRNAVGGDVEDHPTIMDRTRGGQWFPPGRLLGWLRRVRSARRRQG